MSPLLRPRLQALLSVLSLLLVLALGVLAYGWWQVRRSLPPLDGSRPLPGLAAAVKVERDARGVPTITGTTRADVARATGFLHAQDRYFQMDLLRRRGAGELAELFGPTAVGVDQSARLHGFRRTAENIVATLPAADRALLEAYVAGVNAGLAALAAKPWEYVVLRTEPAAWRAEDSLLCIFAMWFDLQDDRGHYERSLHALRLAHGTSVLNFLAPVGDTHDAALDGTTFPAPAPPAIRFEAPAAQPTAALDFSSPELPGSNSFAVDGRHSATGAALVANDMHLGLNVPHIWYRAVLQWTDAGGPRRVAGVTLPGVPAMVVGSNGRIAWGFTNSYIDTVDVVPVETEAVAGILYRHAAGWAEIEDRVETIKVKGAEPVAFTARWTKWGPIVAGPDDGRYLALRWNAHDPASTNLNLLRLETADNVAEALAIGHRSGIPNQNLLVGDAAGRIAWTVTGTIPRRLGYDGRLPVSWAYGDRHWEGWLKPDEVPVVADPAAGYLWTANQRLVGGDALAKLGDGGYNDGFRGGAIRDALRDLAASGRPATPADLHAIMLDDRGPYLDRWQKLLLATLDEPALAGKKLRADLRAAAADWGGRAVPGSAGYRIVRAFRQHVIERTLSPFFGRARAYYAEFAPNRLHTEDAVWQLVTARPARLLNPEHATWESLLLAAADDVLLDAAKDGVAPAQFTWGKRNTLRMQHPFSRFLPGPLARWLDMPADQLPGDTNMPFVQGPRFGQSQRMIVSPGHEDQGILTLPGGQSGHPMSPFYRASHDDWAKGRPAPFLPGPTRHTLTLTPN